MGFNGIISSAGDAIYFVGLIDFLIGFGVKKEAESVLNTVKRHGEDASCVDPESYAFRQVQFVRNKVVECVEPEKDNGTAGKLVIHVESASKLVNADGILGASDPYVEVCI